MAARLLFVLAHPDDESMGNGGTIARHVRAGVEVHLLCLTRGGAGWRGRPPGRREEELPEIRAEELHRAAKVLSLTSVELWDYPDGGVPSCDQDEIRRRIGEHIRSVQPAVVVGWGADGAYFHPDHIACGACTDEALAGTSVPHYHMAVSPYLANGYRRLLSLSGQDNTEMKFCEWGRTSATFRCTADEMDLKMRAIACHVSQLDDRWDTVIRGEVEIAGLEAESYIRVRDTNPAELMLDSGVFPELGQTIIEEMSVKVGDIDVARIGLGTNRLTRTPDNVALVRAAVAAGVQMIDTAHLYTGGQSEETIGEALSPFPEGCIVATKGGFGGAGRGRPEVLRAELEQSFRQLRTDTIFLYYLHRVDPDTPIEESLATIKEYRDRGKIRHVGISEVGIDQIVRARQVVPIAAVQNHYNLSERKYEGVVDYCAGEGIVFVPFYPLRGDGGAALTEIAGRHGATARQITLAWLLRRSPAMLPIPGTVSLEHLKQNLAALKIKLTDAEFEALR